MSGSRQPSTLALAAGLATVFGLAVETAATVPAVVLFGALAFAGARRVGQALLVVLVLLAVAGIRVDASQPLDRVPTEASK